MGMVMKSGSGGGVGGGEIVQVQGGHIVRSTGRKDRHSKVYTAKGPRDRRVRLSAHTAIQFYDVQDRLGYDRPSKAVDWLIKKAKSSIDKLAELPAWHPPMAEANEMVIAGDGAEETESSGYNFHQLQNQTDSSNFNIAASLDSDAIADTMKSFFPTSSAAANSSINFQNYPPHDDLISNPTTTQDLGLSLHSFQDVQGLNIHHHNHHQSQGGDQIQTLFGTTVGFDRSSYQRMVAWSNENRGGGGSGGGGSGGGGFLFNSQQDELPPHNHHQQHESFGQGGTLQSSFEPSVSARGWNDHLQMTSQRSQQQPLPLIHQSSSIFGTRFGGSDGGGGGGLPTFCLPGRMQQGQEAENGLVSDQPSSTSSHNSTHR